MGGVCPLLHEAQKLRHFMIQLSLTKRFLFDMYYHRQTVWGGGGGGGGGNFPLPPPVHR